MHLDAARGSANMCPQRVLILLFDNHRNAGANISRSCFRRKQKASRMRHLDIDRSRYGLQLPESIAAGIPYDGYGAGNYMGLHIIVRSIDFDRTAYRRYVYPIRWPINSDGSRSRIGLNVTFHIGYLDAARCAAHAHIS